jgi:dolichyl-phosphate beta-glucosyltransferase
LLATQAPFVGFCDADMATDLSALDAVVSLLTAGKPLVVGSRGLAASVVTVRHSAVRRGGAAVFRALARQVVPDSTDTQCGFKFFAGPLARTAALRLRTSGFSFDIELIAICQRLGATLTEIPVRWQDAPGSTFSVPRHSAAALRDVATIWRRQRADRATAAAAPAAPMLDLPAPAQPQPLPAGATTA